MVSPGRGPGGRHVALREQRSGTIDVRPACDGAPASSLISPPATAEPVPNGYTYSDAWFTSTDGTQLHAGVFLPADRKENEKHPVLLVSTPYTSPNGGSTSPGNLEGPTIRFPELFAHEGFRAGRWAYVQVDVRGFRGLGRML